MTLFLKSLGVRAAKTITKEFVEPHDDDDTQSEAAAKNYEGNAKAQYTLTKALDDDYIHVLLMKVHLEGVYR